MFRASGERNVSPFLLDKRIETLLNADLSEFSRINPRPSLPAGRQALQSATIRVKINF